MADVVHDINNVGASISSGSFRTEGMVIAPCSMKSMGSYRAFHRRRSAGARRRCGLKESKKLVLVVRETPLHFGHLEAMATLTRMGAMIFPPVPAFYHRPKTLDDVINQTVTRILDQFDIDVELVSSLGRRGHEPPSRRGKTHADRRGQRTPGREKAAVSIPLQRPCHAAGSVKPSVKPKNAKKSISTSVLIPRRHAAHSSTGLDRYRFIHNALPELDLDEIDLGGRRFSARRLERADLDFFDDRRLRSGAQGQSQSRRRGAALGASPWASAPSASPSKSLPLPPHFRCAMSRRIFCSSAISAPCS